MWRREVIRLVLAANWCVAGLSIGLGLYPHFCEWYFTSHEMARIERGDPPTTENERPTHDEAREGELRQQTERLYHSGQTGWWLACGASLGTAVLLMIAFPKKPTAGSPEITQT